MKILILSCALETPGGVAEFINLILRHASEDIQYEHFAVGSHANRFSAIPAAVKPIFDAFALRKVLRNNNFDAVYINPSFNLKSVFRDGLFAWVITSMGIKNSFAFFHGWNRGFEKTVLSSRLLKRAFRSIFAKLRFLAVLSSSFRETLIKLGLPAEKILQFSTMFDPDLFAGSNSPKERKPHLLFMSRLVKEKGCYEALQAFAILSAKYPDLMLTVAGDGPEMRNLMQLAEQCGIAENVVFSGYVRGTQKAKILNEAGLLLFPTYYGEGCPIIILEAMAAGMGIVTSFDGGIPDIVRQGENAIMLEQLSALQIAAAADELLSDDLKLRTMQHANRQKAWNCFEAGIITRKIEGLYRAP